MELRVLLVWIQTTLTREAPPTVSSRGPVPCPVDKTCKPKCLQPVYRYLLTPVNIRGEDLGNMGSEDSEDREAALSAINSGRVRQALERSGYMSRGQIDALIESAEYGLTHADEWTRE